MDIQQALIHDAHCFICEHWSRDTSLSPLKVIDQVLGDCRHIHLVGYDVFQEHVVLPKRVSARHYWVGSLYDYIIWSSWPERLDDVKVYVVVLS